MVVHGSALMVRPTPRSAAALHLAGAVSCILLFYGACSFAPRIPPLHRFACVAQPVRQYHKGILQPAALARRASRAARDLEK